jgi:hypothetical protein
MLQPVHDEPMTDEQFADWHTPPNLFAFRVKDCEMCNCCECYRAGISHRFLLHVIELRG